MAFKCNHYNCYIYNNKCNHYNATYTIISNDRENNGVQPYLTIAICNYRMAQNFDGGKF